MSTITTKDHYADDLAALTSHLNLKGARSMSCVFDALHQLIFSIAVFGK